MLNDLFKKIPQPYDTMIICLCLLVLINTFEQFSSVLDKVIINLVAAVGTALIVENIIFYIKNRRVLPISKSAIISGLIISLIIAPYSPEISGLAALLAIIIKNLLKFGNMPVFNPAASGLLVALLLTNSPSEIWWGNANMLAALILGLIVSWKIGKLNISISYLAAYTLFSILKIAFVGGIPFDQAFLTAIMFFPFFSALFMATEPKTTPVRKETQIAFGILLGLLFNIYEVSLLPYSSFLALMTVNLLRNELDKLVPKPKPIV
ncbi:RnfABCDGE type electron transport complex subunit D [Candidatus Micrarchaeota archaeon]|nr:RnfABCDGE type electron transport complex subunit D [Candidatus Micrarchaeota archaeon]